MRLLVSALALFVAACGTAGPRTSGGVADGVKPSDSPTGESVQTELRRFPGVEVRELNGGISVRIRGESSIIAGQEPLYVVDGQPMAPGPGGTLFGVERADILNIRVLKSASETSFYGSRGANGVVVITTRHGVD